MRTRISHNVIDIPGLAYDVTASAPLLYRRSTSTVDLATTRTSALKGATWRRTMIHAKQAGFLVVDDRVTQSVARTVVQRWNVEDDRRVTPGTARAATSGSGTNLVIAWAGDRPKVSVAKGQSAPLLGWRSKAANQFTPSPVVQASRSGRTVRLTAVIVPRDSSTASKKIKVLRTITTSRKRIVDVLVGKRTWRVTFDPTTASVREVRRR